MFSLRPLALLSVAAAVALSAACGKTVAPLDPDFSATGVRYVPADTPDGVASLFALERAETDARKRLRNHLLNNPELTGLSDDLLLLTIRDDYMRAKTDELIRGAEVVEANYSRDERRGEVTILLDAEKFRSELNEAARARRPAL